MTEEKATGSEDLIDMRDIGTRIFTQEARLLDLLMTLHPGPWACAHCGQRLTADTGWKPMVIFIGGAGNVGIARVVVDPICGACTRKAFESP
jgi:hypothetical protein